MTNRLKALVAAAALLALPAISWAAEAAACCCPLCCR
jgi:hypothetical protein